MSIRVLDEGKELVVKVIGRELIKNGYVKKMYPFEITGKEYVMTLVCTNEECGKEICELFKAKGFDVKFSNFKDSSPSVRIDISKKPSKTIKDCFK